MLVLDRVKKIVADGFDVSVASLTPETNFVYDLQASLDLVEVIMSCEEEFHIQIPDEAAVELVTVGHLASYIENRLHPDETVWPPAPRSVGSNDDSLQ